MTAIITKIYSWILKQKPRTIVLYAFIGLLLLYLIPTFIQPAYDSGLHITHFYLGLPGVLSGDEPHYLITTTSLINDGDYYTDNNMITRITMEVVI